VTDIARSNLLVDLAARNNAGLKVHGNFGGELFQVED
jgi:hypothetical protein